MPIISFLFVFVLVYALLLKTKVLGENKGINLLIAFFLASFFIVQSTLETFVKITAAWSIVFFVCVFMILLLISFSVKDWEKMVTPGVGWVLVFILIIFFVVSSSYVFNWVNLSWANFTDWADEQWFGFVLLAVVGAIVTWVLVKVK